MVAVLLIGCGEKSPEQRRADLDELLAKVEEATIKGDLAALQGMGTLKFEANEYMNMLMRGVEGDLTIRRKRVKSYTDEATILLEIKFGPDGAGGIKEMNMRFAWDGNWRISSYRFWDVNIPGQEPMDSLKKGELREIL